MISRFQHRPYLVLALALLVGACDSSTDGTAAIKSENQSLTILGGAGQSTPINSPLGTSLSVKATDLTGAPVAGISVTWQVTTGGGTVNPATGTTSNDGIVSANYTAGAISGPVVVTATASGFAPAAFNIVVTASAEQEH